MSLRYRRRASLGPLRLNFTRRGLSSIAIKLGPMTHNFTRKRTTVNLPGGLYWQDQPSSEKRQP